MSVVTPLYNRATEIGETLESLMLQDYDDFEVIVVDDGSTDGSRDVVAKFSDRVRLIEQRNRGVGAARNAGIALARGELLCYADADDYQLPYRISSQVHLADQFPDAAMIFSDFKTWIRGEVTGESHLRARWLGPALRPFEVEVREAFQRSATCRELGVPVPAEYADRKVYHGHVAPLVALMHVAWGCVQLTRIDKVREIGGMWEEVRAYEDWCLASELSKRHPLVYMDLPTILYRVHPEQLTGRPRLNNESYLRVIEHSWRGDPQFYSRHKALVDRVHGTAFALLGELEAAEGNWDEAERYFFSAIRVWPKFVRTWPNLMLSSLRHRLPFFAGSPLDKLLPSYVGARPFQGE